MTIAGIRQGLATNVATISGLRTASEIPDQASPPIAIVSLQSIDYHNAMQNGMTNFIFTVQVIVGRAAEKEAQRRLDQYAEPTGATSVKSAIESDKSLNGNCQTLIVDSMPSVGSLQMNDQTYLAAEFSVQVYV
jgi:hypothetical protein